MMIQTECFQVRQLVPKNQSIDKEFIQTSEGSREKIK